MLNFGSPAILSHSDKLFSSYQFKFKNYGKHNMQSLSKKAQTVMRSRSPRICMLSNW